MQDELKAELKSRNISTSLKETTKGVGPLRQPDGCHGSRNPLRNV